MAKVRTCPECGSKFTPIKSQVCCCTRCKEARRRRRSHDYYVQHRITKPKPKPELTPEAMRLAAHAALRARDAAYEREYGHACGRLAHPLAPVETMPCDIRNMRPLGGVLGMCRQVASIDTEEDDDRKEQNLE